MAKNRCEPCKPNTKKACASCQFFVDPVAQLRAMGEIHCAESKMVKHLRSFPRDFNDEEHF